MGLSVLFTSLIRPLALFASLHILFAIWSFVKGRNRTRRQRLPPGPKPLPIVGNIVDLMHMENQWTCFKDLCTRYGDLVYLNVLGQDVVIVGNHRLIDELLEKRSANTSDRPHSYVLPLIGNDVAFSTMRYGQSWRDHRRAFWQIFHPKVVQCYREIQLTYTRRFLHKLIGTPEQLKEHSRYVFGAAMLKILYNIDAKDSGDEALARIDKALTCTADTLTGGHPIEFLPWLRHVPDWVPGARFKRKLAECKAAVTYAKEDPFAQMTAAMDQGGAISCSLSLLLARLEDETYMGDREHYVDLVKNVGLVAFEAGSDTSYSSLLSFFLAMSLHPEAQRKAQAELDTVVGPERLPDFEDRDALQYTNAIIKEVLRWHNVLPLSLPHRTVRDDEIDGFFIPAGTILIPNTWAMMRDPAAYDEPEQFNPDRFIRDGKLDTAVRDPAAYVFGYGRRVCPGRYFAEDMLYIVVACVLHVFNIEPLLDEHGQPIRVEYRQTHGLISHPQDFGCVFKPRHSDTVTASLISGVEGAVPP